MRFLLIDNFDSFTFNIVHYLEQCGVEVCVETNRSIEVNQLAFYDALVLSPGPGLPRESGKLMLVIEQALLLKKPILGICLGMQALAEADGNELYNQLEVKHGISENLEIVERNSPFYTGIPNSTPVGLYHSWAVTLRKSSRFQATAYSEKHVLMSMEDRESCIYAVQFHPESILTPNGFRMIQNFVELVREEVVII